MGFQIGDEIKNGRDTYKILDELGRGRFAITYLTQRVGDTKRWVIKILNLDVLASLPPEDRDRLEDMFWQEATKFVKCSSTPHIVQVEIPFRVGDIVCLPMEYVAGRSLAKRSQGILSESLALEYVRQIGEALTVVHRQGLVHRDIRPDNILIRINEKFPEAVLIDFGLAREFDSELTRSRPKERMDGFSPLELYSCGGQAIGPYTDVYSLAATLYELLTQTVPVSAEERKLGGVELVLPQARNPNISGRVAKAIMAGLALQPEDRPQSVAVWLEQLGVTQEVESIPTGIKWEKWGVIWTAAGVIIALIFGLPPFIDWVKSKQKPRSQIFPTTIVGDSLKPSHSHYLQSHRG